MTTDSRRADAAGSRWSRRRLLAVGAGGIAAIAAGLWANVGGILGREPRGPLGEGTIQGSVLVIGAGPAGMTTTHLLRQRGAEVRVLEAAPMAGGRIAHDTEFADFPISLGGEWIHVDRSVLDDIVADESVAIETQTVGYDDDDEFGEWNDDLELSLETFPDFADLKFVGSSWLGFFKSHILPGIESLITYDTVVERIGYGDEGVTVTDADGTVYEADRVVVTVPLAVLQSGRVAFDPSLPSGHADAIEDATVWSGLKAFIEFDNGFYPPLLAPPDAETGEGQRYFYDAAYGQDTDAHIMGLFCVGAQAERYQRASDELIDLVLEELDGVYDGAASRAYVRHIVHDWNEQPYALGAYLSNDADVDVSRRLAEPIADRVYFAGSAYTDFDDWGSVHAAAWSARDAVRAMLT